MKKIIRAGILSLTFVFIFMFTAASVEAAAAGRFYPPSDEDHVFTQDIQIQEKHKYDGDKPVIHLNKHDLTLSMGKSYTLKATLLPSGKSISVRWMSSNPMIAWVSSAGKVTAVSPGTVKIYAFSNEYSYYTDQTGPSDECCITVPGGAEDAKLLGSNDWTYNYNKTKLTVPNGKYSEALTNVKKSIGGNAYSYTGCKGFYTSLIYGSKDIKKAHTEIYILSSGYEYFGAGFNAREKSPIKTNRGIAIGASESTVLEKYGFPSDIIGTWDYEGRKCKLFYYVTKAVGKNQYTDLSIYILESKGTVSMIDFYLGKPGCQ
jgi:uncharacterized protein YutD